ncbi:MAG: serine hydrolase [Paracoccaceae bacterium]
MRKLKKALIGLVTPALVGLVGAYLYLVAVPPELLRVGSGYASKIICSASALSGRDPGEVLKVDVQAPGNPLLRGFGIAPDPQTGAIRAAFLRFVAPAASLPRPGLGCALATDGDSARAAALSAPPAPGPSASTAPWPEGEGTGPADPALAAILADDTLAGPGMRGIVVVRGGRIVAERYGPGFDAATPQLGWSMTKSVTAALVGTVVDAGKLGLDQDHLLPAWQDDRAAITVAQLMSMSSGLRFNEDYGDVSDVTRMLYLEPDMAAFAANQPLDHAPGSTFSYSSGTAVLLARIWQDAVGDDALAWPRQALFGPLGMGSAVMETDEAGTFVGGSYLYATPRDWARFGLMLLQQGQWQGKQVLSPDFAAMMAQKSAADPVYAKGMIWQEGPGDDRPGADLEYGVPDDAFWLEGHDGQSVAIVPSAGLVVVRMGLTPSREGYRPQKLVAALVKAGAPG